MDAHVYKLVDIVGSSPTGVEDAIRNAVGRAARTVRNMRWFEVGEVRGQIVDGAITEYQVHLKIAFVIEDE